MSANKNVLERYFKNKEGNPFNTVISKIKGKEIEIKVHYSLEGTRLLSTAYVEICGKFAMCIRTHVENEFIILPIIVAKTNRKFMDKCENVTILSEKSTIAYNRFSIPKTINENITNE